MLEKFMNNLGRTITSITLAGSLLLSAGCATYTTLSPNTIQPVKPIERSEEIIDYSRFTWQGAIAYIQTPEQVQDYLARHFLQENEKSSYIPGLIVFGKQRGETFRYNHTHRKGNCFDYATSAAALLSDNNYPPLILRSH